MDLSRRGFIKAGSAALAGSALVLPGQAAAAGKKKKAKIRQYRVLGRTGFRASDISMGGSASEPNVIRYAYDHGINFFDTAESYGNGDSERAIGGAMKHMDRSKIFIVTKLHFKKEATEKELLDRFAKCQERLQTDYVDALYMHAISDVSMVKHKGFHSAIKKLKAQKRVRHAGISSHGPREKTEDSMEKVLLAAIEDGRFDLMLLVHNFMKKEEGERVLKACREHDIGTSCMKAAPGVIKIEPFDPEKPSKEYADMIKRIMKRGKSRKEAVERIQKYLERQEENRKKTPPFAEKYGIKTDEELKKKSIQWVLDYPDMHTVCVGMRDFDQLDKFIPLSGTHLSDAGRQILEEYRLAYSSQYCRHACNDCQSACPQGLPVSTIMRYASYFQHQGREKYAMRKYADLGERDASACLGCPAPCTGACPHGLDIQATLVGAHSVLGFA
jgi:predicted aldo/keto reductase-like oxidoreductase